MSTFGPPPTDELSPKYRRALIIIQNGLISNREFNVSIVHGVRLINFNAKICCFMSSTSHDTFITAGVGATIAESLGRCGCSCYGRPLVARPWEADKCVHIIALFIDLQSLPEYDFFLRSDNNNNNV